MSVAVPGQRPATPSRATARGATVQPAHRETGRRRLPSLPALEFPEDSRRPAVLGTAVVLLLVGGLVATATVRAGSQATKVQASLAAATTAVQAVAGTRAPLVPARLRDELSSVISLDEQVQQEHGGASWTVSRWVTRPTQLGRIDRQAQGLSRLAEAGRPLSAAIVGTTTGDPDADRLAVLARTSAGYAAAARGSGIVMDGGMRQLAAVAAVLPDLAAGPGPRRWTVCPTATGRCEVLSVTGGAVTSRRSMAVARALRGTGSNATLTDSADAATGATTAVLSDVMVTGVAADVITTGQHLSVEGLINVLLRSLETTSTSSSTSTEPVTVRTVVPVASQ